MNAQTQEGNTMANATTDAPSANDQITANIERVRSLTAEGKATEASELAAETEKLIKSVSGTGSVKAKKDFTAQLKAAGEAPKADEPKKDKGTQVEKPKGKAVSGTVVLGREDWHNNPDVVKLVDLGTQKATEGVAAGIVLQGAGRTLAQVVHDMRMTMPHKSGLPDLLAIQKPTKDAAGEIYKRVEATLKAEDVDKADALQALQKSANNAAGDVLVTYLRGLDEDEEKGLAELTARFPTAAEAYSKAKAKGQSPKLSESVYTLYAKEEMTLPRRTRAEIETERRRNAKALEEAKARGEVSEDEPRLTPAQRVTSYLDSMAGELAKLEKNADKLSAAEKRKAKKRLAEVLALADSVSDML
ncbi:hypothetical protein AB0M39_33440 [Streptomyces sp. NPDC051907]|uniref:hypothetical protein n=1 Tax=Streptomyces sp. NPDC051907 TaxID=3155284 RepID=UPI00342817AD